MTEIGWHSVPFLLRPPVPQSEEGGGEGALFVQICLVVEIADGVLHPYRKGVYGSLRAADGDIRIPHEHPPNLLYIVTGLRKIVYMRVESCVIMEII